MTPDVTMEVAVSDSFYPFVENTKAEDGDDIAAPAYTARIAVYDSMVVPPRVVTVPPADVRTYLDEITKNVWELATQQGGEWPFHIIRELVENYIHASFIEPTISIMDKGQTISFSDQGPGIPNKEAALRPTFSSATKAMKRYIRGTGSGLPMVEATVRLQHGTISIEDNLGQGAVITVSMAHKDEPAQQESMAAQTPAQAPAQPQPQSQPMQAAGWNQQPMAPQGPGGWPMQTRPGMQGGQMGQQGQMQAPGTYMQGQAMAPDMGLYGSYQTGYGYYPQTQPMAQDDMSAQTAYPPVQGGSWPMQPQQAGSTGWQGQYMGQGSPMSPWPGQQQAMQPFGQADGQAPAQGYAAYAPQSLPAAQPFGQSPAGYANGAWGQPLAPQAQQAAQNPPQPVQLNDEVAQVLRLFLTHERIGATEASESLGFSKSTGTRRIQEACEAGFIVKVGQKYVLTAAGQMILQELAEGR